MKPTLWLFIAQADRPDVSLALASVAWMARDAGVDYECYLEARRDGMLFSRQGSTVLDGRHHHQFNYLAVVYDIRCVLLGASYVFRSSIERFALPVLAEADNVADLYASLLAHTGATDYTALIAPAGRPTTSSGPLDVGPYLWPEIYHRRALAYGDDAIDAAPDEPRPAALLLNEEQSRRVARRFGPVETIDELHPDETYESLTIRLAERWREHARAAAFADPDACRSLIPTLCREGRVALYAPATDVPPSEVKVSAYAERVSPAADATADLAKAVGDPVLVGRQTGDGDVRRWSRDGLCIQVMDPNRPPFPIVQTVEHRWAEPEADLWAEEPDDATLASWADQGVVLISLLWHSGLMSHNDAMLHVLEIAGLTGVKMGAGVMVPRYTSCPQLWEMLNVPPSHGGVRGLVEPLIYAGGFGSFWEVEAPPEALEDYCVRALAEIERVCGRANRPRGYYGYMNCDLGALGPTDPAIYRAVERAGLHYFVTTEQPGRNRIVYESSSMIAMNQTPRAVAASTPFLRVTTVEELREVPKVRPGWILAALDAPVIAYEPYIWRHGSRFMQIVDWIVHSRDLQPATPHTIARYARLLSERGLLPPTPRDDAE